MCFTLAGKLGGCRYDVLPWAWVQGLSSREFEEALGYLGSPEIAHRDNSKFIHARSRARGHLSLRSSSCCTSSKTDREVLHKNDWMRHCNCCPCKAVASVFEGLRRSLLADAASIASEQQC